MSRLRIWIVLIAALLMATPTAAHLKDIHTEKLPQDPAVLKAYSDIGMLEDMVREWHDPWTFARPKNDVTFLVSASLEKLKIALKSAPDNEELLLFTGLVARYAYNLDIEGSQQAAMDSLARAEKLSPGDYRPQWFLGIFQCQTLESNKGMTRLLALESSRQWNSLSPGFWDDYLYCANITNMPAHALRAGDNLKTLGADHSDFRESLMDIARKRFVMPDPAQTYPASQIWSAENLNSAIQVTSSMFGIQFTLMNDWRVVAPDVKNQTGIFTFTTGPYKGKTGGLSPSILILVRTPKEGETIMEFAMSILREASPKPISVTACPVQDCVSFEGVKAGLYHADGDGHAIITVFQRSAPQHPGLLFEQPNAPPQPTSGQTQAFHPIERLHRVTGTLFYVVLLDSADSILANGKLDYVKFLKGVSVE